MSTAKAFVAPAVPIPDPATALERARQRRGEVIASVVPIRSDESGLRYRVPSQSGRGSYTVSIDAAPGSAWRCECKDFEDRGGPCKHIFAVRSAVERQPDPESCPTRITPKRPTYKQDWPAYNTAQIHEKERFLGLLGELCQGVQEPPRPHEGAKGGRPPVPMGDRVFACALKVYTTLSGRRASTDVRDARDKGHLSRAPHYSRVSRFLEDPAMTPILRSLIEESARPLASIERDFAADSSGFTTCRFESWYDHKYGVVRRQHEWVKVHIMTGVTTNVVTAVEIKGKDAQDAPMLPDLLATTAKRFTMREVSCDKVYASLNNYAEIDRHGATPFIPFKSIHTGAGGGLWAKMYHYYNFNRDEFLARYHKRSNVESTFSMMKAKFGDSIRSKTDAAMVNEALCKVLCHNVVVLIQSACELGIEAKFFWGNDEPEPEPIAVASDDEACEAWAWV